MKTYIIMQSHSISVMFFLFLALSIPPTVSGAPDTVGGENRKSFGENRSLKC